MILVNERYYLICDMFYYFQQKQTTDNARNDETREERNNEVEARQEISAQHEVGQEVCNNKSETWEEIRNDISELEAWTPGQVELHDTSDGEIAKKSRVQARTEEFDEQ